MNVRRASLADLEGCHAIMWASVTDFAARRGMPLQGTAPEWWATGEPLQRFLATHAALWWVAEEDGALVGYARSIEREGLLELTEFFVLPSRQARGVGRALLERAFPERDGVRSIIATTDSRALARYYAAGVSARFPMFTLVGSPKPARSTLDARPIDVARDREAVADLERAALEHARSASELGWLAERREGWIYTRAGALVGFGFVSARDAGPIIARAPSDVPELLLHVEDRAAALGATRLELQLPGPNELGVRHLLARGFHVDPWVNLLMSNRPFGRFDRVVPFGPPVFL